MVALLRGVNVGGRAKLPMADLRAIATDLGYGDVATYIQSGNLVLSTTDGAAKVEKDLAAAIAKATTVKPAVVVRTRPQLAKVVKGNPFVARGEDAVAHPRGVHGGSGQVGARQGRPPEVRARGGDRGGEGALPVPAQRRGAQQAGRRSRSAEGRRSARCATGARSRTLLDMADEAAG